MKLSTTTAFVTSRMSHTLNATYFEPNVTSKGAVLIAGAMGVGQKYYAPFATWLASQGYLAVTFDYAGVGLSQNGDIRKLNINIVDWAESDCAAMIDDVAARASGKPVHWVGHSLGGQLIGLLPNQHRLAQAITVASGSGYWLENSWSLRWRVWWLWFFVVPMALPVFGYFPGRRLRKVGDLPRGVMEQWREWCLDPEYVVGAMGPTVRSRFASVTMPMTSISFVDDEMMSARNTEALHSLYTNAPKALKRLAPKEIGARRIGHFGFFKTQFEDALWTRHVLPVIDAVR